ncbi:MAG: hypothetical protein ACRCYZ_03975 [Alphaproteobacteria bacterium]
MKCIRLDLPWFRFSLLSCFSFWLSSCSLLPKQIGDQVSLEAVSFEASSDANLNAAVSMDLVVVYTAPLYETFKKMTAETYYTSVEQLRRDHYGVLQIWHWEIVPGQSKAYQLMGSICSAVGAVLFVDYNTPGEHRADVGKIPHAFVYLDKQGFRLSSAAPQMPLEEAYPVSLETPLIQHPKPSQPGK